MVDPKAKKGPEPKRVLGRGLDALLPIATAQIAAKLDAEFQRLPVDRLRPQKGQPRKHFDEAALDELADSIRTQGIIQPIVARKIGNEFEIIAGERRWRAAQRAGLREVPVVIKDVALDTAFELALVENLQRLDLDAIETAEAYQRLMSDHGYTQESLARRVGKNRATVANTLRLLNLPTEVRTHVVTGALSEGHARALLSASTESEMVHLARTAVERQWSVRDTERAARRSAQPPLSTPAKPLTKSANVRDLEKRMAAAIGMPVVVREEIVGRSGIVEIGYDSLDQLDQLLSRLLGE